MKIVQTIKRQPHMTTLLRLDEKALEKYMHHKFMEVRGALVVPLEHNTFQNYKYESKWEISIFYDERSVIEVIADITGIKNVRIENYENFLDTHKITQELENIIDGYIAKLVVKMEGIKNE